MSSIIRKLKDRGVISPPSFLPDNTHYETIMGSLKEFIVSPTKEILDKIKELVLQYENQYNT